jgi:hypothetical protein
MKYKIAILIICITTLNAFSQSIEKSTIPFMKMGYGYFNDGLMIDGKVLASEVGIKLNTGYIFSLNMNFADAVNDMAYYPDFQNVGWNFVYSYKVVNLFVGYEFMTKNRRNSFIPMFGPFYSSELTTYPLLADDGGLELIENVRPMVGINLALQYLYNFKNGISIGVNASGSLAFQYGPMYYTVSPVIALKLE